MSDAGNDSIGIVVRKRPSFLRRILSSIYKNIKWCAIKARKYSSSDDYPVYRSCDRVSIVTLPRCPEIGDTVKIHPKHLNVVVLADRNIICDRRSIGLYVSDNEVCFEYDGGKWNIIKTPPKDVGEDVDEFWYKERVVMDIYMDKYSDDDCYLYRTGIL